MTQHSTETWAFITKELRRRVPSSRKVRSQTGEVLACVLVCALVFSGAFSRTSLPSPSLLSRAHHPLTPPWSLPSPGSALAAQHWRRVLLPKLQERVKYQHTQHVQPMLAVPTVATGGSVVPGGHLPPGQVDARVHFCPHPAHLAPGLAASQSPLPVPTILAPGLLAAHLNPVLRPGLSPVGMPVFHSGVGAPYLAAPGGADTVVSAGAAIRRCKPKRSKLQHKPNAKHKTPSCTRSPPSDHHSSKRKRLHH
jgi:hypothetical protein